MLTADEAPPQGGDAGPSSARLLTVAVANCLSASLLFSLRKFRNDPGALRASATTSLVHNEQDRLRVGRIQVDLHLDVVQAEPKLLERALAQFEDSCVITQSVRAAFPVDVRVLDSQGTVLKP